MEDPVTTKSSHASGSTVHRVWRGALLGAGPVLLWPFWRLSSSRIGDTFDYSPLIGGAREVLHGLRPLHDFQTPIQSLTFYYAAGWEALLGQSYAALAWGNFALACALFGTTLFLLEGLFPLGVAFLVALSLALTTVLQHGVPGHNSLGFVLMALQALLAARAAWLGRLGRGQLALLLLLAMLSGMTKLNFHFVGTGAAALSLFCLRWRERERVIPALALAVSYVAFGLCAGPLLEMVLMSVSPQVWWFNTIVTPSARRGAIDRLWTHEFWFGISNDHYPENYSAGIVTHAAILFALVGLAALFAARRSADRRGPTWPLALLDRIGPLLAGGYFLLGGFLLILLNVETQILNAAVFVVGLACVASLCARSWAAESRARQFGEAALIYLSASLLVAAVWAISHFSRINYHRADLLARWMPAAEISPACGRFFGDVRFAPLTAAGLCELARVIDQDELEANKKLVYWGPGLELMNQVNGPSLVPGLPLWYHFGSSVRESDGPRIVETLRASRYRWVIVSQAWCNQFPAAVQAYLESDFEQERNDRFLIVYRRRSLADSKRPD